MGALAVLPTPALQPTVGSAAPPWNLTRGLNMQTPANTTKPLATPPLPSSKRNPESAAKGRDTASRPQNLRVDDSKSTNDKQEVPLFCALRSVFCHGSARALAGTLQMPQHINNLNERRGPEQPEPSAASAGPPLPQPRSSVQGEKMPDVEEELTKGASEVNAMCRRYRFARPTSHYPPHVMCKLCGFASSCQTLGVPPCDEAPHPSRERVPPGR